MNESNEPRKDLEHFKKKLANCVSAAEARRLQKQIALMEDAAVIYRLSPAGPRTIHRIDYDG